MRRRWDLVLAFTLAAGTTGLTSIAPIEGPLRVVPAIAFVLFLPGYLATSALFPRTGDLSGPERLALSLGLSMAIVPLIGLALNFTPWGIRLEPIVVSLDALGAVLILATDSSGDVSGWSRSCPTGQLDELLRRRTWRPWHWWWWPVSAALQRYG